MWMCGERLVKYFGKSGKQKKARISEIRACSTCKTQSWSEEVLGEHCRNQKSTQAKLVLLRIAGCPKLTGVESA